MEFSSENKLTSSCSSCRGAVSRPEDNRKGSRLIRGPIHQPRPPGPPKFRKISIEA